MASEATGYTSYQDALVGGPAPSELVAHSIPNKKKGKLSAADRNIQEKYQEIMKIHQKHRENPKELARQMDIVFGYRAGKMLKIQFATVVRPTTLEERLCELEEKLSCFEKDSSSKEASEKGKESAQIDSTSSSSLSAKKMEELAAIQKESGEILSALKQTVRENSEEQLRREECSDNCSRATAEKLTRLLRVNWKASKSAIDCEVFEPMSHLLEKLSLLHTSLIKQLDTFSKIETHKAPLEISKTLEHLKTEFDILLEGSEELFLHCKEALENLGKEPEKQKNELPRTALVEARSADIILLEREETVSEPLTPQTSSEAGLEIVVYNREFLKEIDTEFRSTVDQVKQESEAISDKLQEIYVELLLEKAGILWELIRIKETLYKMVIDHLSDEVAGIRGKTEQHKKILRDYLKDRSSWYGLSTAAAKDAWLKSPERTGERGRFKTHRNEYNTLVVKFEAHHEGIENLLSELSKLQSTFASQVKEMKQMEYGSLRIKGELFAFCDATIGEKLRQKSVELLEARIKKIKETLSELSTTWQGIKEGMTNADVKESLARQLNRVWLGIERGIIPLEYNTVFSEEDWKKAEIYPPFCGKKD